MRYSNINTSKKIAVSIMIAMMLFLVLFSSFFVAIEADNDCTGDDCPVCQRIHMCENTLRQLSQGHVVHLFALIFAIFILRTAVSHMTVVSPNTLFSIKVRLNN